MTELDTLKKIYYEKIYIQMNLFNCMINKIQRGKERPRLIFENTVSEVLEEAFGALFPLTSLPGIKSKALCVC